MAKDWRYRSPNDVRCRYLAHPERLGRYARHVMTMITVNADGHPIMSRMHKPADEKRSVVILRPDDWEDWLTTPNVEAARAMLQLYPADEMTAEAK